MSWQEVLAFAALLAALAFVWVRWSPRLRSGLTAAVSFGASLILVDLIVYMKASITAAAEGADVPQSFFLGWALVNFAGVIAAWAGWTLRTRAT